MALEHSRTATEAAAVLASAQSITRSIESLGPAASLAPVHHPGWRVLEPDAQQLSEVRKFVQAESVPGEEQYAFVFPHDCDTNVICTRGSVAIFDLDNDQVPLAILTADPGNSFHFAPRGSKQSMRAQTHPTQVLCVMWREAHANERSGSGRDVV